MAPPSGGERHVRQHHREEIPSIGTLYAKEYRTGDSRDGAVVNGDGYHYYRMSSEGRILEAYEFYETDDGVEVASPLPEMLNVSWKEDLGFEDLEALDVIKEGEFDRVRDLTKSKERS